MQVERMKLGVIRANAKNPRTISTTKFEQLVDSILIFPRMLELRPIVIDASNVALGGNMRKRALDAIVKMKPADIKERLEGIADYKKLADDERAAINVFWGKWIASPDVPVVKADMLTESQKRQFIIKDNVAFGQWDWDMLADKWDADDLQNWGLDTWGEPATDEGATNETSTDGESATPETTEEDNFDEETEKIKQRTKAGDIWILGDNRLMCGDSTKTEDVARLLQEEKMQLVFTDPPYGVNANGTRNEIVKERKMKKIANDNLRGAKLEDFLYTSFINFNLQDNASVYICGTWRTAAEFLAAIQKAGLQLNDCIIWNKNVFGLNGHKGYRPKYELIYFASKGSDYEWYGGLDKANVWDIQRETDREKTGNHRTPKPVELCGNAISNSSKKGDNVLDLFGGSGSTLIACQQLGRKCYMMELDPYFCDVIITRWEKFTGMKARKAK